MKNFILQIAPNLNVTSKIHSVFVVFSHGFSSETSANDYVLFKPRGDSLYSMPESNNVLAQMKALEKLMTLTCY